MYRGKGTKWKLTALHFSYLWMGKQVEKTSKHPQRLAFTPMNTTLMLVGAAGPSRMHSVVVNTNTTWTSQLPFYVPYLTPLFYLCRIVWTKTLVYYCSQLFGLVYVLLFHSTPSSATKTYNASICMHNSSYQLSIILPSKIGMSCKHHSLNGSATVNVEHKTSGMNESFTE